MDLWEGQGWRWRWEPWGLGRAFLGHSACLGQPRTASWVWQGREYSEGVLVPQDGDMGAVERLPALEPCPGL